MTMTKTQTRVCSIDIFRWICSILVVAIHSTPFAEINQQLSIIFTNIIPTIGVPFFFTISGYYYIKKLESNEKVFFPYIKRLILTYFVWSCIYFLYDFIKWGHTNIKGFISNCIILFMKGGSFYHLWFFAALIFSVCLTTLIFKTKGKKAIIPISVILYIIGCAGCSYYNLSTKIPVLGDFFSSEYFTTVRRFLLMAFPFFVLGFFLQKIESRLMLTNNNKNLYTISFFILLLWVSEIILITVLNWKTNYTITLSLYMLIIVIILILLKNPMLNYSSFSKSCRSMANFMYFSHPLVMICIELLFQKIFDIDVIPTLMFLLTISITSLLGLLIHKSNNRFLSIFIN